MDGGRRATGEELRLELLREDALQLQRYTGQNEDVLAPGFVDNARRHATFVLEYMSGVGGDAGHTQVALGHVRRLQQPGLVHPPHAALDFGSGLFPDHQLATEGPGNGCERAVVRCRPEASADENVGDLGVGQLAL